MIQTRMAVEHAGARARPLNEWRVSAALVVWPLAAFDSDQAITGLMAKHLAELRAFPVFYYGQNYLLAVEAWLAAAVFAFTGASVTALRLPLLAINIAIAWLLLRGFVRET